MLITVTSSTSCWTLGFLSFHMIIRLEAWLKNLSYIAKISFTAIYLVRGMVSILLINVKFVQMEIAYDFSEIFSSEPIQRLDHAQLLRFNPRKFWAVQRAIDTLGQLSTEVWLKCLSCTKYGVLNIVACCRLTDGIMTSTIEVCEYPNFQTLSFPCSKVVVIPKSFLRSSLIVRRCVSGRTFSICYLCTISERCRCHWSHHWIVTLVRWCLTTSHFLISLPRGKMPSHLVALHSFEVVQSTQYRHAKFYLQWDVISNTPW